MDVLTSGSLVELVLFSRNTGAKAPAAAKGGKANSNMSHLVSILLDASRSPLGEDSA